MSPTTTSKITIPEGMTPADAIRAIADEHNLPVKLWVPEDLDEYLLWYPKESREQLRNEAQDTRSWRRALEEVTETDWTYIQNAVSSAAETLGLEELSDAEMEAEAESE